MSSLHIISKSPGSNIWLDCRKTLGNKDLVLLIEDGIYHAALPGCLSELPQKVKVFVLRDDVLAQGMSEKLMESAKLIGYDDFVQLCCDAERSISWF